MSPLGPLSPLGPFSPIDATAVSEAAYAFGLWTGWGVLHSVLASRRIKAALELVLGPVRFALYPFLYSAISVWTFYMVMQKEPDLPQLVWAVGGLAGLCMHAAQVAGVGLLIWAALTVDGMAFLGLRQVGQFVRGRMPQEADPERDFRTTRAYGFVRHPMHLGGILILALQPRMSLTALTFAVFGCLYIVVGSLLEERRMAAALGQRWQAYSRSTPMFLPWPRPKADVLEHP